MPKGQKKVKPEFNLSDVMNDDVKKRQLRGFVIELADVNRRIKSEREAIKDIVDEAKESMGVPPKLLRKLVKEELLQGVLAAEQTEIQQTMEVAEALANVKIAQVSNP